MSEEKNISNKEETVTQQESIKELKENELEDVSGGLFGITIIDECPNKFDLYYCMISLYGKCPRLIIEEKKPQYKSRPDLGYKYVVTCSKGVFTKYKETNGYDL